MFRKKLARSTVLRLGILFVLVLALLVTVAAIANAPLAPLSHQVAAGPDFSTCATGPAWGSSPAADTSSRLSAPRCPPLVQPLASWGS
jgi:hypothetical protein